MPEFPPDDKEVIPDEELLYIRVYPQADYLVPTPEGGFRPRSGALRSDEPLSVDRSSLCTPEQTRDRDQSQPFHVAAIRAKVARAAGCGVTPDPVPGNEAHALIHGGHARGGMTMKQAKLVARQTIFVLLSPLGPLPA
jgi:hypothetical protein